MGIGGWKTQNNGLVRGALFFSSPHLVLWACFVLHAKCRIHLAWLIKDLLCKLPKFLRFFFGSVGLTIKQLEHICIHLVYPKFIYDLFQILTIRTLKVLHLPDLLSILFYLLGVMMELGS